MKVLRVQSRMWSTLYFFKKDKEIGLLKVCDGVPTIQDANPRYCSVESVAQYYRREGTKFDLYTHKKDIPDDFWESLLRAKIATD